MDTLLEELLAHILAFCFYVPPAHFFANDAQKGARLPTQTPRPAQLLRVARRWLRIGTPLLYASVRVHDARAACALARFFRAHPRVGAAVRSLRLARGGKDLCALVAHMPGLRALGVDLDVRRRYSAAGFACEAFAALRIEELYVRFKDVPWASRRTEEARAVMFERVKSWGSLRRLHISLTVCHRECTIPTQLVAALESSSVEEVVCDVDDVRRWIPDDVMQRILDSPCMKRVVSERDGTVFESPRGGSGGRLGAERRVYS
ncbi:hypothetical protein PsYK624_080750 [Phanerochaete sordida]|uniref:Uncharacterized protein n=1 Tax=Phanerochaete sordida TaxID=48140 RepID=A0A9P3G9L1_9APHY|nr:hypothetical protein PsYK624_080750 [Phanerochaete sordida]